LNLFLLNLGYIYFVRIDGEMNMYKHQGGQIWMNKRSRKSMSRAEYRQREEESTKRRWKARNDTIEFFQKVAKGEETYHPRPRAKFLIRNPETRRKLGV